MKDFSLSLSLSQLRHRAISEARKSIETRRPFVNQLDEDRNGKTMNRVSHSSESLWKATKERAIRNRHSN